MEPRALLCLCTTGLRWGTYEAPERPGQLTLRRVVDATQIEAEAEDETGRRADGRVRAAHAAQRDGRTQPAAPAHDDGKAEVAEVGGGGGGRGAA